MTTAIIGMVGIVIGIVIGIWIGWQLRDAKALNESNEQAGKYILWYRKWQERYSELDSQYR